MYVLILNELALAPPKSHLGVWSKANFVLMFKNIPSTWLWRQKYYITSISKFLKSWWNNFREYTATSWKRLILLIRIKHIYIYLLKKSKLRAIQNVTKIINCFIYSVQFPMLLVREELVRLRWKGGGGTTGQITTGGTSKFNPPTVNKTAS